MKRLAEVVAAGLVAIGLVGGLATDPRPDRRVVERAGYRVLEGDFHVHTTWSDGMLNPAAVVRQASRRGLDVIETIRTRRDDSNMIVLTGYGNIATAVTAVKLGAVDYLSKPADADEVFTALTRREGSKVEPPENPMSADRVRWEHIQRVYEMCDRNVSETARRLNMHRRTLQRISAKRAPK